MIVRGYACAIFLIASLFVARADARAATVPAGFAEALVSGGITAPTAMAFAPDGRLFVCEQTGAVRVIKNGVLLPDPFLEVTTDAFWGEQGLLGIAFDPTFATAEEQWVYVYYTVPKPDENGKAHNRISRFTAEGDVAVADSEFILMELDDIDSGLHMGGAMHFGSDGKLYVAIGEDGTGTDAQLLTNRMGKILRLEKDGSIPDDNPLLDDTSGPNQAIWAYGLRNPFTFAVHPATGALFINDVGAGAFEEINQGIAGANYGWPVTEGGHSNPAYEQPIYFYGHTDEGGECAISGGTFYSPAVANFPESYDGTYFFADYCAGWIKYLDPANSNAIADFATGLVEPVDLQVGPDGNLYYLQRSGAFGGGQGKVYRIAYGVAAATIDEQPHDTEAPAGEDVTFTVVASGTAPLTYQWKRNNVEIPGATSAQYTIVDAGPADDGALFVVTVSNDYGSETSGAVVFTLGTNVAPTAAIGEPEAGSFYSAGETIAFSGSAMDPEDGDLGAAALTWQIDFHHDTHHHPFMAPTPGIAGGTFVVPVIGETSDNVWYRIYLTALDSRGRSHTTYRDVLPRKARITLATSPGGLMLTLDGQPIQTSASITGVTGITRELGVVAAQEKNGLVWEFDSWSDGGADSHDIATPATDTTYTAVFRSVGASLGGGTGLTGTYYNKSNFKGSTRKRTDATVDFNWGNGAPIAGIAADTFSVRWIGQVQAEFTETYTFYTQSADGVRLWVNGQRLIDNWRTHALAENQATIDLVAGTKYDIRMEFFDNTGTAVARLLWSSASIPKEVVPVARLFPPAPAPFTRQMNFQPAPPVKIPNGYRYDNGAAFGSHRGLKFGWNTNNTANAFDRNSTLSPDQRYDTLVAMQPAGATRSWEIVIPNGTYDVTVVAGDATTFAAVYKIDVEGVLTVNGTPSSLNRWVQGTQTVQVTDGRLTITNASGASNNKICFVNIVQNR
jgi:glucose/arabinose dehydrogenase